MNLQTARAEAKEHLRKYGETTLKGREVRIYAVVTPEGTTDPESYNYRFDRPDSPVFVFQALGQGQLRFQESVKNA